MNEVIRRVRENLKRLLERESRNAHNSALNYALQDSIEDQVDAKISWGRVEIINEICEVIEMQQVTAIKHKPSPGGAKC